MIRINTYEDIENQRKGNKLSETFLNELERYFKDIVESLTDDADAWRTYDLKAEGPIWILEPDTDNPENLPDLGSLYEAPIEFTSVVKLTREEYFRTILVLDNEYCLVVFSEIGGFPKLDELLQNYLA